MTVKDKYPLSLIREMLQRVQGSKWFVALDLRSRYWQIPIDEQCKHLTAFCCTVGFLQFKIMLFGLTNAPGTFQRCMDYIFKDLMDKGVSIYLDDILVHHKDYEKFFKLT